MKSNELGQFSFLLMDKINCLLDFAEPNETRFFQLFKTCQFESSWNKSFDDFKDSLSRFYSIKRIFRRKSDLDAIFDRPIDNYLYDLFQINFYCAYISENKINQISDWAFHYCRSFIKKYTEFTTKSIFKESIESVIKDAQKENSVIIQFSEFCICFKNSIQKKFGNRFDLVVKNLINDLIFAEKIQKELELKGNTFMNIETVWIENVKKAVELNLPAPDCPFDIKLKDKNYLFLHKTIRLYNLTFLKNSSELEAQMNKIKSTLMKLCVTLINI